MSKFSFLGELFLSFLNALGLILFDKHSGTVLGHHLMSNVKNLGPKAKSAVLHHPST